jgi:hypothetical protein
MSSLLTTREVAAILKCSVRTLAMDRSRNYWKIPYIKIGRRVLYDSEKVAAWIKENAKHITP